MEEVDHIKLVRLQRHLTRELVHTELFDNFQDVKLFVKLASRIFEQEVISLLLRPAAATVYMIETQDLPKSQVLVAERLSRFDLSPDFDCLFRLALLTK